MQQELEGKAKPIPYQNRRSGPGFARLLVLLLEASKRFYQDRLITLAVYGSVGRGTASIESDVDFLLVATELPRGRTKRISEFRFVETQLEAQIKQMAHGGINTYLSPVIKTPDEVLAGSPLFLDMIDDAVILYDKDRFFRDFLEGFKTRLRRLGARRIIQGDRWYWDLKPDYKPGEIFEL